MSSTKRKEIVFFFKPREKLQQPQQQPQQQHQNNHRPIEEIQIASSAFIPEIPMNYQPHQPPKTLNSLKTFMINKTFLPTPLIASDRTRTCFQRDLRRKSFSKHITKTGKKPLKRLTSTKMSQVCPLIWSNSSTMSKCP